MPNVYICVDNVKIDKAAYNFCQLITNELKDVKVSSMICSSYPKETNRFLVEPIGKDWNVQLSDMKKKLSVINKIKYIRSAQSNQKSEKNKNFEECL